MTEWEHVDVKANGLNFHCVTQGEGPLVLMLHGFPECWYSWRGQIPPLSRNFRVVAPDMRGYNLSDKPAGVKNYTGEKLTADVAGLISAFGHKKAHLVGHDWGGVVAWQFAAAYPEMLDRLAVMNAPHPAVFARNILGGNVRQLLRSWYILFFQVPRLPEFLLSAFSYAMLDRSFRGWAVHKEAFTEEVMAELKGACAREGALTGGINYYRAIGRDPRAMRRSLDFPVIESPTLLIWATEDRALGTELTFGMEPYFGEDKLRIRYVPDCSHWVQQEQPALVTEYLEEFLLP